MLLLDPGRFGNRDLVTSKGIFLLFLEFWKPFFFLKELGSLSCLTGTEMDGFFYIYFVALNGLVGTSRVSNIQSICVFI